MSWPDGWFRLFVSHAADDHALAARLADELRAYWVHGFVAPTSIAQLSSWPDELSVALRSCDAVLALVTKSFVRSAWTNQEIGCAIGSGKLVVPLSVDAKDQGFLRHVQHVPADDRKDADVAGDVFRMLADDQRTCPRVCDVLAERLCASATYRDASRWMSLGERIRDWPDPAFERIRAQLPHNRFLRSAANQFEFSRAWLRP